MVCNCILCCIYISLESIGKGCYFFQWRLAVLLNEKIETGNTLFGKYIPELSNADIKLRKAVMLFPQIFLMSRSWLYIHPKMIEYSFPCNLVHLWNRAFFPVILWRCTAVFSDLETVFFDQVPYKYPIPLHRPRSLSRFGISQSGLLCYNESPSSHLPMYGHASVFWLRRLCGFNRHWLPCRPWGILHHRLRTR